jgi:hypothetical protein
MALRLGYGTGVFNAGKYGLPQVYEGAAAVSVASSATSSAEKILIGVASDASSISTVASGVRERNVSVSDTITTVATSGGYITIVVAVSDSITTSVYLYWNRIRPFSASARSVVEIALTTRYKWINTSTPLVSWVDNNASSVTWINTTVAPVTWMDADYREGAA